MSPLDLFLYIVAFGAGLTVAILIAAFTIGILFDWR